MDCGISGCCKPRSMDIHCFARIPAYKSAVVRGNPEHTNKPLGHWFRDTGYLVRMESDGMGSDCLALDMKYWSSISVHIANCKTNNTSRTLRLTLDECISIHSTWTTAHRDMIVDFANGIRCTNIRTWIRTFAIEAGLIAWTIEIQDTFRPATRKRISVIFCQTSTYSVTTMSIRTTRRWVARIISDRFRS